jgi:hypothetical protein
MELKIKDKSASYCDMNKIGHVRVTYHFIAFAQYLYLLDYSKQSHNITLIVSALMAI